MVIMYTDGASSGNPGPGGYGTVLIAPQHNMRKEFSEGFRLTTNNRMELLAVIVGLEALKYPNQVEIYSDSQYVINTVEKGWLKNWLSKPDFAKKKNEDLWRRFDKIYKKHRVRFHWVKGHAGNLENERCDFLATSAAAGARLLIDHGYEAENA